MNMIEIKNLSKDYGKGRGIFNVDFSVKKGEVFGFLGPNGAGKTTTIRHLMGFINPDSGHCTIGGLDCRKNTPQIQKNLGYVPGEMPFFDDMTGIGFIKFIARFRKLNNLSHAEELMQRFELDASGKLKRMSKGMKQKIGIVLAFMHDPEIIILDEPTSGLDPLMQNRFVDLIQEEADRGKTILMSSHMFEEVERTCDRVGIIRNGRLVAIEEIEHLKKSQTQKYIVTFENPKAAEQFQNENLQIQEVSQNRVTVIVKNDFSELIATMGQYPVTNIDTEKQSLEEIFMHYYGGDNND